MICLRDVAERAGVSVTTCSRVLNGARHLVAPSTREKVEAVARELGYERTSGYIPQRVAVELLDLAEVAWAVIANVGNGNWSGQSDAWRGAAENWRKQYHGALDQLKIVNDD